MGLCHLPPERVKLTVNTKKETNSKVKMGQESKLAKGQDGLLFLPLKESEWAKGQDGLLLFTPCCCLPHDRVKLTENSKKKQTAGSKWAKDLWLK